jgi:hypothetical protein
MSEQSPKIIPILGESTSINTHTDLFKQLQRPRLDLLFAFSQSVMMNGSQQFINNAQLLLEWLAKANIDWQVMVVHTEVSVNVNQFTGGCAAGITKIITPQTPNPIQQFRDNLTRIYHGYVKEQGLIALYSALTPPLLEDPKCNQGFYRPDSTLAIIFASDEIDQSPHPDQFYTGFFKHLKGLRNLDLLRISAIVGPPPHGCQEGNVTAKANPRYWQISKEFPGVQTAICSSNWANSFIHSEKAGFGFRRRFPLSRQAIPNSLQIMVNGSIVKEDPDDGWQYDHNDYSIQFSQTQIPIPASTIKIEYKTICLP